MARILISTRPGAGHFNPMSCIARELAQRGHEVAWHTADFYANAITALGVRPIPMRFTPHWGEIAPGVPTPPPVIRSREDAIRAALSHVFVHPVEGQLKDYADICATFAPDALLGDNTSVGVGYWAEKIGVPFALLNISVRIRMAGPVDESFRQEILPPLLARLNEVRAGVGLEPMADSDGRGMGVSPYLNLQQGSPLFEYPEPDLPANVRFVGALLPPPPPGFVPPSWWDEVTRGDRPIVHVTQGTVATDSADLLRPTVEGLQGDDSLLVVATTGGKPVESLGWETLPANIRLEPYIPHSALLPYVRVMVTNAGMGGVMAALAHGVPLVAAGATQEKPEVCARVAHSGVGINLQTGTPTAEQVGTAVRAILDTSSYREKARAIADDMARHDGPTESATYIEGLLA